jgi:hypothetical protein
MAAVSACVMGRDFQPRPDVRPRRLAPAAAFAALALLSLPPGLSGSRPRLGAPFVSPGEPLLARRR